MSNAKQIENFHFITQVRPDSKGRVTLSKLAKEVSSFNVLADDEGRLLLEPMVEIPAREKWLWDNPKSLESLKRGIKDAGENRVEVMSFSSYLESDKD